MITVNSKYPIRVKIKTRDDGEKVHRPKWCYLFNHGSGQQTLCTGEFFGVGESGCEYEQGRGKITCPECIKIIKELKAVKL